MTTTWSILYVSDPAKIYSCANLNGLWGVLLTSAELVMVNWTHLVKIGNQICGANLFCRVLPWSYANCNRQQIFSMLLYELLCLLISIFYVAQTMNWFSFLYWFSIYFKIIDCFVIILFSKTQREVKLILIIHVVNLLISIFLPVLCQAPKGKFITRAEQVIHNKNYSVNITFFFICGICMNTFYGLCLVFKILGILITLVMNIQNFVCIAYSWLHRLICKVLFLPCIGWIHNIWKQYAVFQEKVDCTVLKIFCQHFCH